ncbi:DUF1232 domain-containing protein [bacterium]|nr:DUF1232 domain-containing protein [bacterium]
MDGVKLNQNEKHELLRLINSYADKVSEDDIKEIEKKINQKIKIIKKNKRYPSYVKQMIRQVKCLYALLKSPDISKERLNRVISALHYFVLAEDMIPDYIQVRGYLDDAFVIDVVYQEMKKDIRELEGCD